MDELYGDGKGCTDSKISRFFNLKRPKTLYSWLNLFEISEFVHEFEHLRQFYALQRLR
jgi:Fe2+ or Zn2+ uptake regulation protein